MQNVSSLWRRALVVGAWMGLAFVVGCGTNDTLTTPEPSLGNTGTADFSSYVAIGNSLTAGFQSAALTESFNDYSYPALIARQVGIDPAAFVQPEIAEPGIGSYTSQGAGKLRLVSLAPLVIQPVPLTANPATMLKNATYAKPFNNLGIPGSLAVEIPTATSAATSMSRSPFFDIVLRNPAMGNKTALQQALALDPTFVTIWLGYNDVLGFATSGGVSPAAPVPVANVQAAIMSVVMAFRAADASIVIANIPPATACPYFTTLKPYLADPTTGVPILVGGNKVYLIGPGGTPLTDNDMVLLSAKTALESGVGVPTAAGGTGQPLGNQYVLSAAERAQAEAAVDAYNAEIEKIADGKDCGLVDIHRLFDNIAAEGVTVGGVKLRPKMITGGLFSLDGVHPNNVGYSIIANEFIKTINTRHHARIPLVNVAGAVEVAAQ